MSGNSFQAAPPPQDRSDLPASANDSLPRAVWRHDPTAGALDNNSSNCKKAAEFRSREKRLEFPIIGNLFHQGARSDLVKRGLRPKAVINPKEVENPRHGSLEMILQVIVVDVQDGMVSND
jgi:hypothetical protein